MAAPRSLHAAARRARGWCFDRSLAPRLALRRLRETLSVARYRARALIDRQAPARIVVRAGVAQPWSAPAIGVWGLGGASGAAQGGWRAFAAGQTEPSLQPLTGEADRDLESCSHLLLAGGASERSLPPNFLEALLLVAAVEDAELVIGGPAPPGAPTIGRFSGCSEAAHTLLRVPRAPGRTGAARGVVGRLVPFVTRAGVAEAHRLAAFPRSGPYLLDPLGSWDARVAIHRVACADRVLAELPEIEGPPTALLLLPYLAVGGAERLLLELLAELRERCRFLVVTVEPHRAELGQTVTQVQELTPYVYTLGDWLPRMALPGAVRHLLRRYRVSSLLCWNGCTFFYDQAPELRRAFPRLRILNQLFNHRGGWIEHYGGRLLRSVNEHIAINRPIAETLRAVWALEPRVIPHGVRLPVLPPEAERRARRRTRRAELGLPEDALVVGTFVRLHPQKRPLDVVRLARRFARPEVCFLLAGGGPLEGALERELERQPTPNLLRLPQREDPGAVAELFDALDLCLLTSEYEGLPLFLLEGLARELPCVATAVGEVRALLGQGAGIVVERPGDLDALEAGVRALLDPVARRAAGRAGRRQVAERHSLGAFVRGYESALFGERDAAGSGAEEEA